MSSTEKRTAPELYEVEVVYSVHRKVYVAAPSPAVARKLAAGDTDNWADAGELHEDMDTLRLPAHRVFKAEEEE